MKKQRFVQKFIRIYMRAATILLIPLLITGGLIYCTSKVSKEIVWPASSRDSYASDLKINLGHIPYGALLAILPVTKGRPDLHTLGLSEPGKRVAKLCGTMAPM